MSRKAIPPCYRSAYVEALRTRDGDACCFGSNCAFDTPLDFDTHPADLPQPERISIEHRRHWYRYRSNDLDGLALGHSLCNQRDGLALWRQRGAEGNPPWWKWRSPAWPALTYAEEID